ncbi:MAG: hypothetical protein WC080_02095 [Patescibacteria group bacterium]
MIIFILLSVLVIATQIFSDGAKAETKKPSPLVMPAKVIEFVDLGLKNAAADLNWLASIQYFGDWQDDDYAKLTAYIKATNELDPKFSYPYAFGAIILPGLGKTNDAIAIAKDGIANSDPDYRIPYYLAVTYFLNKQDYANAAYYFDVAARTAGAPDNVKAISASFNSRPDLRAQSIAIWTSIFENSNDEVIQERAKAYIIHYEILNILEVAAEEYKNKTGNYPANIEDLVTAKILTAVPKDPFGFTYLIDNDGRARINQ